MTIARLIPMSLVLVVTTQAAAVDLSQVSRSIGAQPEYRTQPKYALLVFGPQAATRVWLVHDGDALYADLNGDGDLTDPAERIAAHEDSDDGTFRFEVGDLRERNLLHKSLSVGTMNLRHLAETNSRVKTALGVDPKARFYRLGIDLQMLAHRGAGIDGRVEHLVGPIDAGGLLRFADSPEVAPIIHFGGSWEITLYREGELTSGRQTEVYLSLGTPGLGPGTTAFAAYEKVVPAGTYPKLHVTFPGGEKPVEYVLRERCCTINFHGGVRLADDAPTGEASVRITLDDWLGGFAKSTTHSVKVAKPKYELVLEPVSPRLKGSLIHPSRDEGEGSIVGVRYSPDGRRIIAGDYPGGVVQLWDAKTGLELTTIETGYGFRGSLNYFHLTPEGQVVYVPHRERKFTSVERDGKKRYLGEFEGEIRCFDPDTGEVKWQLQDSPPRGIIHTIFSPDGKYIASFEELPGEYDGNPKRRLSLWNTQTGTRREFSNIYVDLFSPDGSRFVAGRQSKDGYATDIDVYDVETGERISSSPIREQPAWANVMDFTPDGEQLIGNVTLVPDPKDGNGKYQDLLKFWNAATGEEVGSIASGSNGERFSGHGVFSPDGQTYALGNWRGERAKLYFIDMAARRISKTVDFGENLTYRGQVFSPDGRWIAAATQYFPENVSDEVSVQDLPQPRIHLIEAATGEIRETIVCPQSSLTSLCFSPDGQTLATSGPGRVLLWDLSTPPGELAKP